MKLEKEGEGFGGWYFKREKGNDFLYEWRRRIAVKPYVEDGSKLEEWKE
jgi:hypothetical protein